MTRFRQVSPVFAIESPIELKDYLADIQPRKISVGAPNLDD